jgi:hypothetical protein
MLFFSFTQPLQISPPLQIDLSFILKSDTDVSEVGHTSREEVVEGDERRTDVRRRSTRDICSQSRLIYVY